MENVKLLDKGIISNGEERNCVIGKVLQFKKLGIYATLPVRASKYAAGYDLFSATDIYISAHGKQVVPTDIAIAVPIGYYGRVAPRSGLTVKHFLDVGAGVIDSDFRGNVSVVMFNFSDVDYQVSIGDRIAQLIIEKIYTGSAWEVFDELNETSRGEDGFGSTGK